MTIYQYYRLTYLCDKMSQMITDSLMMESAFVIDMWKGYRVRRIVI